MTTVLKQTHHHHDTLQIETMMPDAAADHRGRDTNGSFLLWYGLAVALCIVSALVLAA